MVWYNKYSQVVVKIDYYSDDIYIVIFSGCRQIRLKFC